jgi:hypothetical protein
MGSEDETVTSGDGTTSSGEAGAGDIPAGFGSWKSEKTWQDNWKSTSIVKRIKGRQYRFIKSSFRDYAFVEAYFAICAGS